MVWLSTQLSYQATSEAFEPDIAKFPVSAFGDKRKSMVSG
jgi:hypothetical protein